MFANLTSGLDFQSKALVLRAERQRVIADTPGFSARDLNFKDAMRDVTSTRLSTNTSNSVSISNGATHPRHIALTGSTFGMGGMNSTLAYTTQSQPSLDGNSVDLDRERANFVDNSVRYEATLRFINGQSRTILSAIQGQ